MVRCYLPTETTQPEGDPSSQTPCEHVCVPDRVCPSMRGYDWALGSRRSSSGGNDGAVHLLSTLERRQALGRLARRIRDSEVKTRLPRQPLGDVGPAFRNSIIPRSGTGFGSGDLLSIATTTLPALGMPSTGQ
jgi:hypothetical protein